MAMRHSARQALLRKVIVAKKGSTHGKVAMPVDNGARRDVSV